MRESKFPKLPYCEHQTFFVYFRNIVSFLPESKPPSHSSVSTIHRRADEAAIEEYGRIMKKRSSSPIFQYGRVMKKRNSGEVKDDLMEYGRVMKKRNENEISGTESFEIMPNIPRQLDRLREVIKKPNSRLPAGVWRIM